MLLAHAVLLERTMTLIDHSKRKGKARSACTANSASYNRQALACVVALALLHITSGFSQINPASPTSQWTPLLYGNDNFPDPSSDQQTGSAESDIVGNLTHPSLYMRFHDGGSGTLTNGWWGFRLRLGADVSPTGFKGAAFIGVDANLDGKLDLFIGVNNQGSGDQIGIWNPGTGLNISPSTTSIVTPALYSYLPAASVYNFSPVSASIDPAATSYDLNGDGKADHFLTFVLPFWDVVSALSARGITGFTASSPTAIVAATATQANSLNQDLNGVTGGVNSSQTWAQLGATTLPYSPNGVVPVPEPSQLALFSFAGGIALICILRQKARM